MNRTCSIVIDGCECVDPPVLNLSSEAPDPLVFTGVGYAPYDPYSPPRLGNGQYIAHDCYGVAYSVESQELADLLAKMNSIICQQYRNNTLNGGGWTYANDAQTAYLVCSSLSSFWYTVPAGTYVATFANPGSGIAWLAAANAAALAYANQQVQKLYRCIGSPQISGSNYAMCLGEALEPSGVNVDFPYTLSGTNSGAEYTFEVTSGALPTGVTLVQTAINSAALSGTPTVLGTYQFTVRATMVSNSNIYAEITNTIEVFGISNSTMTSGEVGTPYSEQLNVSGGTAPYTFEIVDGSLPDGLTMDSDGLVTGTPTTDETANFDVKITDSDGHECVQNVSLSILPSPIPPPQPIWSGIEVLPTMGGPPTPDCFFITSSNTFSCKAGGFVRGYALLFNSGPDANFELSFNFSSELYPPLPLVQGRVTIYSPISYTNDFGSFGLPDGPYVIPFTLLSGQTFSLMVLAQYYQGGPGTFAAFTGSIDYA